MTVYLAEVLAGEATGDGQPLWWSDARRRIPDAGNGEWDEKSERQIEFSRQFMDRIDTGGWAPPNPELHPASHRTMA